MTSIVIMSTIGTTLRSALVAFLPLEILPPRTFDFSKRFAGRLPGVTMGMVSLPYPPLTVTATSPAPTAESMTWTRSPYETVSSACTVIAAASG